MIERSVIDSVAKDAQVSCGTSADWDSLMQKKDWKIAFLGGSVTCGYIAQHMQDRAYPQMVTETLKADGLEPELTLCAEPGMFTLQANMLLDTYVLPKKPDLVFLEFAINEMKIPPSVKSFESLIRRLLTLEKPPIVGVIILRSANDYSCENYMQEIAAHYGLPCINVRKGMNAAIEKGQMAFADYGDHESHPYEDGHRLIAECVMELLRRAKDCHDYQPAALPEPWIDPIYEPLHFDFPEDLPSCGAEVIPLERTYFKSALHLTPEHPTWEITVTTTLAVVLYEMHSLPNYGYVNVYIDGKPPHISMLAMLHSNSFYGWGNSVFSPAFWESKEPETHTIRLELVEGEFFILGFAANRCDS
ncbi:MAG: hypothetical protein IK130_06605 [Oscillospiraceae bacterium]|nr:hypothetical protein [Oscillospiraceae bacterium]